MSDIREIEALLARNASGRAVLVTLVKVEGSSYRKPGARMVVTEDGEAAGAISGGCLEKTLCAHAIESMTSEPHQFELDTTTDTDMLFGHGLGCPGKLRFLIEPFAMTSPPQSLCAHERSRLARRRMVHVTSLPGDGEPVRSITRPAPEGEEDSRESSVMSRIASEARCTGYIGGESGSWFVEVIDPPLRVMLIGAGLDVAPFIRVAESVGLDVKRIVRSPIADPYAEVVPPENVGTLPIDARTAVVVMTHNYLLDLDYLRGILAAARPLYLGVIGSRSRFQKLVSDLAAEGFPDDRLSAIRGPAGLDVGAETPAQIALSILSEIQAIASEKASDRRAEQSVIRTSGR